MNGIKSAIVFGLMTCAPQLAAAQMPESPGRVELAFGGGARIGGSDTLALGVVGPTATLNIHPRVAAELPVDFYNRPGRLFGTYILQGRVALLRPKRFPTVFATVGAAGRFEHHSWYGWTDSRPDGARVVHSAGDEWLISPLTFAGGVGFFAQSGSIAVRCDVQYVQTSLRVTGGVSVSLGSIAHRRP